MKTAPLLVAFLVPTIALAQAQTDPVSTGRMRLGPAALTPAIALSNFGVDTNVFNEVENPKRDFTFTASPRTDLWLRTQRGLLSVNGRIDLVYFSKYHSERAVNGFGSVHYVYRFNRLRPFASFSGLNARERPGFEIDIRARRFENTVRAGMDARVASKGLLEVSFRRDRVKYAGDALFAGRPLNQTLNRVLEAVDMIWRQPLTVLTTWTLRASVERERFDLEAARNGNSFRAATGFELGQLALIRGNAFVGYRRLTAAEGGTLPQFSGVTADVDVSYTAPFQTRLSLQSARDVQYSFELANPYYVQTGWTASLTQRITGRWDFQLRGGRDRLTYRGGTNRSDDNRRDRVDRVGAGIGYQLGANARVSFDVHSNQRQSQRPGRDYKALRAGISATYGL